MSVVDLQKRRSKCGLEASQSKQELIWAKENRNRKEGISGNSMGEEKHTKSTVFEGQ